MPDNPERPDPTSELTDDELDMASGGTMDPTLMVIDPPGPTGP